MPERPIYLDYQATTPVDPRVLDAMLPCYRDCFGNPHSVHHEYGFAASRAVASARAAVAELIGADDDEIVFVSGATESCNLAFQCAVHPSRSEERNEIVTLATEHPAVLETARALASLPRNNLLLHELPVKPNGLVDLDIVRAAVSNRTLIVSTMLANNEIGVVQPVAEIASIARRHDVLMHTDATQAAGRLQIDVDELGVDLLSLSSHKIYGPMGVGALYIRKKHQPDIVPLLRGGGQERGLRSGTVPLPLVVGFGKACELAIDEFDADTARIAELSSSLRSRLLERFPGAVLNGHPDCRVPDNINLSLPGLSADEVVATLRHELAFSTGSACSSTGTSPSHVLLALGRSPAEALGAFRLSLGRFTTPEEVNSAFRAFDSQLPSIQGAA